MQNLREREKRKREEKRKGNDLEAVKRLKLFQLWSPSPAHMSQGSKRQMAQIWGQDCLTSASGILT